MVPSEHALGHAPSSPRDGAPSLERAAEGWVEVICGPMFSGKTEELIRRLERAQIQRLSVQVFKPAIDIRFDAGALVSHSDRRLEAVPVSSTDELAALATAQVVGIDEAQFLDSGLVNVVERLAARGQRVVVAGLDLDYEARPFEPIVGVMARAEYVTKLLAVCVSCGRPASRSQRIGGHSERVCLGAAESYRAVCRSCHQIPIPSERGEG